MIRWLTHLLVITGRLVTASCVRICVSKVKAAKIIISQFASALENINVLFIGRNALHAWLAP